MVKNIEATLSTGSEFSYRKMSIFTIKRTSVVTEINAFITLI